MVDRGVGEDRSVRSLLPDATAEVTDDELVALYQFPYDGRRPWTRAIFISSADGSAQGADGASASLSSPGDRRVFSLQRSLCDVVLVGAGTARVEGYRPVQPSEVAAGLRRRLGLGPVPALAVVSRSLRLDPRLLEPGAAETIVVTTQDASADAVAELAGVKVIQAGFGALDIAAVLRELARLGHHRVLCEGGPTLLAQVVAGRGLDVRLALEAEVYFDTASYGRRALELCLATYGVGHVIYGSDAPVIDSASTLREVRQFGDAVTAAICEDNPTRLLA